MEFRPQQLRDGITLITLDGGLDNASLKTLRNSIDKLLADGRNRIVIDCAKLTFVSSAGIGALVMLHRQIKEAGASGGNFGGKSGGELRISGAAGAVFEVMELMNLGSILNLSDNVQQACQALGQTQDGTPG